MNACPCHPPANKSVLVKVMSHNINPLMEYIFHIALVDKSAIFGDKLSVQDFLTSFIVFGTRTL